MGRLLVVTTINYIDRQTLSVLAPLLQKELRLSTQERSCCGFPVPLASADGLLDQVDGGMVLVSGDFVAI